MGARKGASWRWSNKARQRARIRAKKRYLDSLIAQGEVTNGDSATAYLTFSNGKVAIKGNRIVSVELTK